MFSHYKPVASHIIRSLMIGGQEVPLFVSRNADVERNIQDGDVENLALPCLTQCNEKRSLSNRNHCYSWTLQGHRKICQDDNLLRVQRRNIFEKNH